MILSFHKPDNGVDEYWCLKEKSRIVSRQWYEDRRENLLKLLILLSF